MKETPLPLTVLATMHVGAPLVGPGLGEGGAEPVEVGAVGHLDHVEPETHGNLPAMGWAELTSSMVPSIWRPLLSTMTQRLSRGMVAGEHRGLPHLSLLDLAVAEERVDAVLRPERPG